MVDFPLRTVVDRVRLPAVAPYCCSSNGKTSACQVEVAGSNPASSTKSNERKSMREDGSDVDI
jgi:hypothetical protein